MMKAFIVEQYGSKDGVRVGEMPDPQLREDDVLVQIHAAGVNLLDSKIRDGAFKLILPYRLPLILGNDVAGVVVRVGSRVRRFKVGDEVYARPDKDRIGTFARLSAQPVLLGKANKYGFLMRHIGLSVRYCRFDTVIPMHATASHCTSAARAWPAYRRVVHPMPALP